MNRRQFLQALSGGVVAGATVPFLPISAPPLETLWQKTARQYSESALLGRYAPETLLWRPPALDVVHGVGVFRPDFAVRFVDDDVDLSAYEWTPEERAGHERARAARGLA